MKTPRKRRDGVRPTVPPDVELRPTGGPAVGCAVSARSEPADPPSVGIVHDAESIARARHPATGQPPGITIEGEHRDGLHCIGFLNTQVLAAARRRQRDASKRAGRRRRQ
jgi:hypothetical protein